MREVRQPGIRGGRWYRTRSGRIRYGTPGSRLFGFYHHGGSDRYGDNERDWNRVHRGWALESRRLWIAADAARRARQWREMRELARKAEHAERAASPEGWTFAAVLRQRVPDPPEIPENLLPILESDQWIDARSAVKAEMQRHAEFLDRQREEKMRAERERRERERQERRKDVLARLKVGEVYTPEAAKPYKGIVWIQGLKVLVPNYRKGAKVRIVEVWPESNRTKALGEAVFESDTVA